MNSLGNQTRACLSSTYCKTRSLKTCFAVLGQMVLELWSCFVCCIYAVIFQCCSRKLYLELLCLNPLTLLTKLQRGHKGYRTEFLCGLSEILSENT